MEFQWEKKKNSRRSNDLHVIIRQLSDALYFIVLGRINPRTSSGKFIDHRLYETLHYLPEDLLLIEIEK